MPPNDGTTVATLRVATNESWKERASGKRKQRTEWVVCFRRLAEIVGQYLNTDRDATQRSIIEVIANDMRILDSGKGNVPAGAEEPGDGILGDALPR